MAAGMELCPHCRRPFKRLRAHLPHCKAAPAAPGSVPGSAAGSAAGSAPGSVPGSVPGSAAGSVPAAAPGLAAGSASTPGSVPGSAPASAPGSGSVPGSAPASAAGSAPGSAAAPAASPRPALGTGTDTAPGSAAGPERSPGTGTGTAPAQPPGPGRRSGPRSRSAAVQDVARSLDLHPEEVQGVPRKLQSGVQVLIEKHRARVLRDRQPRSGGEGTDPGAAAAAVPQRPKTARKSKGKETRSQGASGSGTGSPEGEKSHLKATKAREESRKSRGELVQKEGRDRFAAGEEQLHVEFGVGSKAPLAALRAKNLRVSPLEAFGGDGQGTSKTELSRRQRLRDKGGEGLSEPGLNAGTAPQLGLLHTAKIQPVCPAQSARSTASGLEWFPDLYPDYEGLRIFPGKRFREDLRMAAGTPKDGLTQGQQGPLSERPLLEVRLGELHSWIRTCSFSPQGLLGAVHRAWSSYCAKYIHVKQGGPAGISMLLAGYCLFSYGWNYQHFKRHRWRKYH